MTNIKTLEALILSVDEDWSICKGDGNVQDRIKELESK